MAPSAPSPRASERTLVVQQSFPDPRPSTNPYIVMLRDAVSAEPGVVLRTFSWRRALLGRYDVFHVHWPEILVTGRTPTKAAVRRILTALLLIKLRVQRVAVVRTVHNLELPEGLSRAQRRLLTAMDRAVSLRICLNDDTPVPAGHPSAVIPHGHYREWFARHPRGSAIPGRLAFFGLIRRYKGVERLLQQFANVEGDVSLVVAGNPSSDDLADSVRRLAAADDRVEIDLSYLSDAELVQVATHAELVVLPYRFMHNSGGTLAALSLDRPVLVPDTETNAALAAEVGDAWVLRYQGELKTEHLSTALRQVAHRATEGSPDLSARDWDRAGRDHVAAYRRALTSRRGR